MLGQSVSVRVLQITITVYSEDHSRATRQNSRGLRHYRIIRAQKHLIPGIDTDLQTTLTGPFIVGSGGLDLVLGWHDDFVAVLMRWRILSALLIWVISVASPILISQVEGDFDRVLI